jgi:hypothetical protein
MEFFARIIGLKGGSKLMNEFFPNKKWMSLN